MKTFFLSIYRWFIRLCCRIYLYSIKFAIDFLVNIIVTLWYIFFVNDAFGNALWRYDEYKEAKKSDDAKKRKWLRDNYKYRYDGFRGFPDWNILHPFTFCILNYRGDCDDFSKMAYFLFPSVKMYMILPYNLKMITKVHVIAYDEELELVYSSGVVHKQNINTYLKKYQKGVGDCFLSRYY